MRCKQLYSTLTKVKNDLDKVNDAQSTNVITTLRGEYITMMFIMGSDKTRYGNMICTSENNFTWGSDRFPLTLNEVYNFLVKYNAIKLAIIINPISKEVIWYFLMSKQKRN